MCVKREHVVLFKNRRPRQRVCTKHRGRNHTHTPPNPSHLPKLGKHCSNVCLSCLLLWCSFSFSSVDVQIKVDLHTWQMMDWEAALFLSWEPVGCGVVVCGVSEAGRRRC